MILMSETPAPLPEDVKLRLFGAPALPGFERMMILNMHTQGMFSAKCSCGRIFDVSNDNFRAALWDILLILHPELRTDSRPQTEEWLLGLLVARHELSKGGQHKAVITQTIYLDAPTA